VLLFENCNTASGEPLPFLLRTRLSASRHEQGCCSVSLTRRPSISCRASVAGLQLRVRAALAALLAVPGASLLAPRQLRSPAHPVGFFSPSVSPGR
jgi:hypothetical protein